MRHSVGLDQDPNCLQGYTADDDKNCSWQAKSYVHTHVSFFVVFFFAVIVIYILHFLSQVMSL